MKKRALAILGLLLSLLSVTTARATSVVLLPEQEMVARADWILRGLVLSVEDAVRDQGLPAFQDVTIEVGEILKGEWTDPVLHIAVPGGEIDGRMYLIPGVPTFHAGEEVLVFLTLLPTGEKAVVGLRQGKYRIVTDPATGIPEVERSLEHLYVVPRQVPGQTLRQALSSGAPDRESWGTMRARIRSLVEQQSR